MLDGIINLFQSKEDRIAAKRAFLAEHGTHRVVFSKEANMYAVQHKCKLRESEWSGSYCEATTEEKALDSAIYLTKDELKRNAIRNQKWEVV